LAASLGLTATARSLAAAVIAEISAVQPQTVFVLSPGDRWAFEDVYPHRLDVTWPAGIAVRAVIDVVAEARETGRVRLNRAAVLRAYAYHDPCHSPRIERDGSRPRALVEAILGRSTVGPLFWREHRAHPCGATGGLEFTQPALASQLADARLADAAAAGATTIVTEDPACAHHLRQRGKAFEVINLYDLLAEHLE
jgi:Fe-S oxidoreductase